MFAARTLAERALREAGEAKTLNTVLVTKLDSHLQAYNDNQDRQNTLQVARDLDSREWRAGLGKRLDRQDAINMTALCTILGIAVSIIAFLIAPFFHHA